MSSGELSFYCIAMFGILFYCKYIKVLKHAQQLEKEVFHIRTKEHCRVMNEFLTGNGKRPRDFGDYVQNGGDIFDTKD